MSGPMQGILQLRAPDSSALADHPSRRQLPRELVLVVGGVLALLTVVVVAILAGGGGGVTPPATGAAKFVPADALAYANLSLDPGRPSVRRGARLATQFPDYPRLLSAVETRLADMASGGAPVDFARDIKPWVGNEAALAVLNTTTSTAGSLILLDVRNRRQAQAFLTRSQAKLLGSYHGRQMFGYPTGTELAFIDHFLVFGQDASVRSGIDVAAGDAPSLADDPTYQRVAAGEPADRVLDAYASAAGIRRVLVPRPGVVGAVGAVLDQPALVGASLSLSPSTGGARMRVHSVLDPQLLRVTHSSSTSFVPTLQNVVPAGSMLLLDTAGINKLAPRLLRAGAVAGVGGQVSPLLARLSGALGAEGVNVKTITTIFGGETAVAIAPAPNPLHAPSLTFITRTRNAAQANAQLGAMETPLAQLFAAPSSGPGQAPLFNDRQVAGVTAHQLALNPGLQLDYAVFNGLVVVSTSLDGIAAVANHARALGSETAFRAAAGFPSGSGNRIQGTPQGKLTSLVFLDFSQLLSLGEQTGLSRNARFRTLQADLQRIRAVGLHSTGGGTDTTAELFLQIQ